MSAGHNATLINGSQHPLADYNTRQRRSGAVRAYGPTAGFAAVVNRQLIVCLASQTATSYSATFGERETMP